jgi:hypothetical protein
VFVFQRATNGHIRRRPDAKRLNLRGVSAGPCPHNAGVEGSSPSLSTSKIKALYRMLSSPAFAVPGLASENFAVIRSYDIADN